jgi:hypothetical protein
MEFAITLIPKRRVLDSILQAVLILPIARPHAGKGVVSASLAMNPTAQLQHAYLRENQSTVDMLISYIMILLLLGTAVVQMQTAPARQRTPTMGQLQKTSSQHIQYQFPALPQRLLLR